MKNYLLSFGTGDSRLSSGLSPTLLIFANMATGATITAPSISEIGTTFGLYTFQWGTTTPIAFLADGATTGLGSARYIRGAIDPADRADEYGNTLVALGNTQAAQSTSGSLAGIGTAGSTFGGLTTDPVDLFGYVKRIQELLEGDQFFTKGSGALNEYNRGASYLLRTKTIANSVSMVTRT